MNRNFFKTSSSVHYSALPVAGGLFFIMQYLIASADPRFDDAKQRTKLADIHMPEREIDTNVKEQKPEKVDDPGRAAAGSWIRRTWIWIWMSRW